MREYCSHCDDILIKYIWLHCLLQLLKKGVVKKSTKGRGGKSKTPVKNHHCEVFLTTANAARTQQSPIRPSPSHGKAQGSLHLLKDLKKIQTSLRADDIVWDS